MQRADISVIVPTLNRAAYLETAIASVVNQHIMPQRYEILVIDNGSTDNTRPVVDSLIHRHSDHRIRYFFEPVPGLLSGRHRGALEAEGNVLVFIDDDIRADADWLSAINETFKDPQVHLVGGRNLPDYMSEPPEWLHEMWSVPPDGGRACASLSLLDLGDEEKEIDPDLVWGLNFSIRKKTLLESGGFHPDCLPKHLQRFQGDGEYGVSSMVKEKGLRAVYQPKALVYHVIPPERFTVDYFEKRHFFQGVCDSYTRIRAQKGEFNKVQRARQGGHLTSSSVSGADAAYEGYLDRADCSMISGWAWDADQPDTPVRVDIFDDGKLIETLLADDFRQDLLDARKGSGEHAFHCQVPGALKDGRRHIILARISGAVFDLTGSPRRILCEPDPFHEIKARLWKAYRNGYEFHQREVRNDPQLLRWVLKDDYWDYRLPVANI